MRFFSFVGFGLALFCIAPFVISGADIDIVALVPGCGDSIVDVGEECDTLNVAGESCVTRGFSGGTLSCTASCTFNTTACTVSGGGGSGGGGGGGGGNSGNSGAAVVFTGRAYPTSVVTILKDGQIIAKTVSGSLANFQVSASGLSAGNYTFSVYGEDSTGLRSSILTFPVMVTRGVLTKIDDIFIAPTLAVDKSEVRRGDTITIFGQSAPQAAVTLEVNSPQQFFVQTPADKKGVYLHNFDTAVLDMGEHTTKSKSATSSEISPVSTEVGFVVGTKNVPLGVSQKCPKKADMNRDCRVNLVDFSIAAFWYKRTLTADFAIREKSYLNGDGQVNIIDFSIMAFYWTG